jgi:adenosylcobinamide-phosphate synthase
MTFEAYLGISLFLDFLFGDPRWYPHPVKIIGNGAQKLENISRKLLKNPITAGIATTATTLFVSVSVVAILFLISITISQYAEIALAVFLLYSLIATKDLVVHSSHVHKTLYPTENIEEARVAVAQIVGRDTAAMSGEEVSRACIETVAENMVDGITAPLFWAILCSLFASFTPFSEITMAAIGMLAYKVINTMDSMFGYKNTRYLAFGWAPARLDDLANFIPARLSAFAIILAAFLMNYDGRGSWTIVRRDRLNHASPNAGHTEAALAGALGIRLGGQASYFGCVQKKPYIGDPGRNISPPLILDTNKIILVSAALFLFFCLLLKRLFFD